MSRTYIGPFGRILPVVDNSDEDSSSNEDREPSSQSSPSNMATYQLPPPPIPTRLDFGSDPRPGFSEPKNYDLSNQSRRAIEQNQQVFDERRRPQTAQHGQLPSVSQLLTPGSQSSNTSSPYSTHQSIACSDNKPEQSSPKQSGFRSTSPPQVGVYPYQNAYATFPYPIASHDNPPLNRPSFAGGPAVPSYSVSIQPLHGPGMSSDTQPGTIPQRAYPAYPPQPPQPPQVMPLAAAPYSPNRSAIYNYSLSSYAGSDQSPTSVTQSVKPLPRVVGEENIPGEGPCWVYEDGSICRKVIDGEPVNAQWGVTKAGRPRKRLAIACTTCREKKIKCDPGEGKCQQCDKFGRECRFTTA
ncbi:MAG: hypothetical protein LQ338_002484 [Usnochroma carphineum]|nr:MAG: hypothetical protein LQ338_002484 [Usnochroma carphineum]